MFPQHSIAVYSQGAGVRRRGRGPRGFSAFAGLAGNVEITGGGSVDVAILQQALNAFSDPSWEKLVVDGVMGPKTRARIDGVRWLRGLGRGEHVDANLLQVLGISGNVSGAPASSGLAPSTAASNAATSSASAAVTSAWGSIASAFGYPPAAASAALSTALTTPPGAQPVDYTKWVLIGGAAIGAVILISTLKR